MPATAAPSSASRPRLSVEEYVAGVRSGDRANLAQAITLIESRKPEHQEQAQELLLELAPLSGKSVRVGISGVPGAGKSTFIDTIGTNLTKAGHKVAVLAVDPTSARTGGSILGDKTRMANLATNEDAFIRPSPTSGTLGGVTRTTRETILVCEAAGFDIILVETVGVGQSEVAVSEMVDFFMVLLIAGAGDELQGIKKGVLEIADMIALNKADGDNEIKAKASAAEYQHALRIIAPKDKDWAPPVVTISALENRGLDNLWDRITQRHTQLTDGGGLATMRQQQQVRWMWAMVEDRLVEKLKAHPEIMAMVPTLESAVTDGSVTPALAVNKMLKTFGV
ncbi:MAG: methylmalonyl Co-A mutase-associated GTPase MeaB [Rhodospirillaceae bacterium]|jgi:LAO/AO transport system kinase|nr:methylmalonyl Co-A mutase-associated GTPase MeaB [Rhodospirillaceae bacterium]MBT5241699.1 methylmalonyl Co-A mutase-associated GTPase MeaB [Rhodospirillaceae bacterium]MBT5564833.1 methylmalonyl Co-A mutase-associated GTPase MeaB [Rhodospirillaceae bacterium]